MRNRASCYPILSRVAAITLAWLRALSLGLLGVMLGPTPAEAKPFAYVTNSFSNTVSVNDTATNTVVATVPVGFLPFGVAITPSPVTFACPLGQGFWKNHPDTWPVTSLTLGSQTYTQAELLALFDT